jgi:hypothetical protein
MEDRITFTKTRALRRSDCVRGDIAFRSIAVGHITFDEQGAPWVFVGWSMTKAGHDLVFVKVGVKGKRLPPLQFFTYRASYADTLVSKFPDLIGMRS